MRADGLGLWNFGEGSLVESFSFLSLAGIVLYALVAFACALGWFHAKKSHQRDWHRLAWAAITFVFLALIASRVIGLESLIRTALREHLRAQGLFDSRRDLQGWVIAVAISVIAAAGMIAFYWTATRTKGRRNIAVMIAIGACFAMLGIVAMRMISLHAMDQLLYGPLKLNWVGDIGASLAVLVAATFYAMLVQGKIGGRNG